LSSHLVFRECSQEAGCRPDLLVGTGGESGPHQYAWADCVYPQGAHGRSAECVLVLIGATPEGKVGQNWALTHFR
jgi:hypothetical protein